MQGQKLQRRFHTASSGEIPYALFAPNPKQLVRINFEDVLRSEVLGGLHTDRDIASLEFIFTASAHAPVTNSNSDTYSPLAQTGCACFLLSLAMAQLGIFLVVLSCAKRDTHSAQLIPFPWHGEPLLPIALQ